MTAKPSGPRDPAAERIAAIVGNALAESAADASPDYTGPDEGTDDGSEAGPSDQHDDGIDMDIVRDCAGLDVSDTDNGLRLRKHFGRDLCVFEQEGVVNTDYVVWTGTHWDMAKGLDRARLLAQRIGARIAMEAAFLNHTPDEAKAIARAETADPEKNEGKALIKAAADARVALDRRKAARRKFGVHAKNVGRIKAMLDSAAPHLTRSPDDFNPDPLRFATLGHTISLRVVDEDDPECPDPESRRMIRRVEVTATPAHAREDMITHLLPVHYDPAAQAPRFEAFMERFQPDASTRRAVQISVGAGLLGVVVQKFFFHYGAGANGKSIFLELMARVLGQMAIILPTESIVGQQSGTGANASPDIARLYGKRFVRITELAEGEDLKEALVKKLTGGERIAARALFKGFFEFLPICKPHGSGNGYPRITGTDNGIWRRMTVFHWPVTLHEDDQREFEVVLSEFAPEYPGILNWLIRGAELFLLEGFKAPKAVKEETAKYREEMDPISGFVATCLTRDDDIDLASGKHSARVQARDMYHGYRRWAAGNGRKAIYETRFGRLMDKHFYKHPKERVRYYYGVRMDLDGLPELPELTRSPNDDG